MSNRGCVFCKSKEGLTGEHIFPASIGGVEVVLDATCKPCNEGFSHQFEAEFNNALKFFCFLFQIGNRDKTVPNMTAKAVWDGVDINVVIQSDGTLRMLGRAPVERITPDGRKETEYYLPTDKERERFMSWAKSEGKTVLPLPPDKPMTIEPAGSVPMNFIGEAAALRSAAKVALMCLAKYCGTAMAATDSFAGIREFIRSGNGDLVRLFVNPSFSKQVASGPHQHSVVAFLDGKKHTGWAIVRYFGGLCYLVSLSTSYEGADYGFTYVYDAYKREQTGLLAGHLEMERLAIEDVLGGTTTFSNIEEAAEHFHGFIEGAISAKMAGKRNIPVPTDPENN